MGDLASYVPEFLSYSNGIDGPCGINGSVQGVAEEFVGSCGTFQVNFSYESCGVTITIPEYMLFYYETQEATVSCDPQNWIIPNQFCTLEFICPETSSTEEYTLVRTFTADDGCGNTSTCDVTYTWSIASEESSCGYEIVECGSSVTGDTSDAGAEDIQFLFDSQNWLGNMYTFIGTGQDIATFSTCENSFFDTRLIVKTKAGTQIKR